MLWYILRGAPPLNFKNFQKGDLTHGGMSGLLRVGGLLFCLITSKHPASNMHPPTSPIKTQKQNKKPWRAQEKGLIIISLPAYNLSINCLWYIDTFVTIFYKFASEWNWWNMNKLDSLCCFPHINSWSGCVGSFSNGVVDTNAPTVNF